MKTLNLSSYDVKEMNEVQMSEVNGGVAVTLAVIGAVAGIVCATAAVVSTAMDVAYRIGYNNGKASK